MMVYEPVGLKVTAQVAIPGPVRATPAAPPQPAMAVPPLRNSMFPVVGVPEPGLVADTVPVKVTEVLTTEGLRLEVTTVVVAAAFTTWVIDVETADAAKFVKPRYWAVMVCEAAAP